MYVTYNVFQLLLNTELMHEASSNNYTHFLLLNFGINIKFSQISASPLSFAIGYKKRLELKRNNKRDRQADRQVGSKWTGFVCLQNFGLFIFGSVCGPIEFSGVFLHRIRKLRLFPGVFKNRI
jgi:hypothetical protein